MLILLERLKPLTFLYAPAQNVRLLTLSWRQSNTFTSALPGDDDDASDSFPVPQVHHPDGEIHVVVVKNGASPQVGVFVSVHCIRGMAILPTHPWMSLVVHPSVSFVSQILNWEEIQKSEMVKKKKFIRLRYMF